MACQQEAMTDHRDHEINHAASWQLDQAEPATQALLLCKAHGRVIIAPLPM